MLVIIVILIILWLVVEVMSILLKMTGLDLNKARFQIISVITHTGFTTRESELISQHPLRRRLISIIMLISYIAQVTLISALFTALNKDESQLINLFYLLLLLSIIIYILYNSKFILKKLDWIVEKTLSNKVLKDIKKKSIDEVFKTSPGFGVYELIVDDKSLICGLELKDSRLKDKMIQVLKIDRGSSIIDFPSADSIIYAGDKLIVYGKISSIINEITGK